MVQLSGYCNSAEFQAPRLNCAARPSWYEEMKIASAKQRVRERWKVMKSIGVMSICVNLFLLVNCFCFFVFVCLFFCGFAFAFFVFVAMFWCRCCCCWVSALPTTHFTHDENFQVWKGREKVRRERGRRKREGEKASFDDWNAQEGEEGGGDLKFEKRDYGIESTSSGGGVIVLRYPR